MFFKSSFRSPADTLISQTAENKDESLRNNLTIDDNMSDKPLM